MLPKANTIIKGNTTIMVIAIQKLNINNSPNILMCLLVVYLSYNSSIINSLILFVRLQQSPIITYPPMVSYEVKSYVAFNTLS